MFSQVGDQSIDLPEAHVVIQLALIDGSRMQVDQFDLLRFTFHRRVKELVVSNGRNLEKSLLIFIRWFLGIRVNQWSLQRRDVDF